MSFHLQKVIFTDVVIKFQVINCKNVIGDTETIAVSTLERHYLSQCPEIVILYASTK